MSDLTLIINRGAPGEVPGEDCHFLVARTAGMTVLDGVLAVQRSMAPDLAVRWNCRAGKCGSCAAEINGFPRLLCKTLVGSLPAGAPVRVEPMQTFVRIKDLVTDVRWNYEVNENVPPIRIDRSETWRWLQRDVYRSQEMRKCIECFLCQDVCHVLRYRRDEKPRYAGPRFFVRVSGLDNHPMDAADRLEYLRDEASIGLCNVTRCCTDVCPEGIQITDNAIVPAKERLVDRYSDPLRTLWRKLHGPPKPE